MDDAPLLEGEDDDLLDYFFSDDVQGADTFGGDVESNTNIDQVNDSMASLLFSPNEGGNAQGSGFMGLEGTAMVFDNENFEMSDQGQAAQNKLKNAPPGGVVKEEKKTVKAKGSSKGTGKGRGTTTEKPAAKSKGRGRGRKAKTTDDIGVGLTSRAKSVKIKAGGSSDADKNTQEDKRLRRLARNRESARQSRRRKKEHLELLEEKVAQLTSELDGLRRQYMEKADETLREHKLNHLAKLNSLIENNNVKDETVQNELREGLLQMDALYGPNSEEQRLITEYHYNHLFSLLLPTYSKYFVWMLNQGEHFFADGTNDESKKGVEGGYSNENRDRPSVWKSFSNELHLTTEQQEKLKSDFKQQHADGPRMERQKLSTCINILEQLKSRLLVRSKVIETHSRALLNILTPEQTVKYLMWTEQNRDRIADCRLSDIILQAGSCSPAGMKGEQGVKNANGNQVNMRLQAAKQVLEKPEADMQLGDLKILLAALDVVDG